MSKLRWIAMMLCVALAAHVQGQTPPTTLQLRKVVNHALAPDAPTVPVPPEAVRVYVHEGEADAVWIHPETIAVQYMRSGVLFDRKTGEALRRLTVAEGWPAQKPAEFPSVPSGRRRYDHLVGPGVLEADREPTPLMPGGEPAAAESHAAAATIEFGGRLWQAMQPIGFLNSLRKRAGSDLGNQRKMFGSWTAILQVANAESFLESRPKEGDGAAIRYTMNEGLASNLVTHLAVADGRLWAACVDIYDPDRKAWGPGGLSCYDPKTSKWNRVESVGGRPVRWVTLMQTVGDDLWIGSREGDGVAGDTVMYGMGLYPGQYRPIATAVTLARLSGGTWTTFSRAPLESPARPTPGDSAPNTAPGETPRTLTLLNNRLFLFSQSQVRASGNWDTEWAGHVSMLDLAAGTWRAFDTEKDLAAYQLDRMVAEDGELLMLTDKGVRRWSAGEQRWIALDPHSPVLNPSISAVVCVGKELWVGYTNLSFGVMGPQGISRFNEETKEWDYTSPEEIGTACPVRSLAPAVDGTVLALFRGRNWMGAAAEFPFYREPRGPSGLGRFKDGKWQFPITLDGVPTSRTRTRKGPNGTEEWQEPLPVQDMAAAGGKLYVSNPAGIYEGPDKWRLVIEAAERTWPWQQIEASEDGKTLEIQDGFSEKRTVYDPARGKTTEIEQSSRSRDERLRQDWTEIPTRIEGSWAIGDLEHSPYNPYHRVVETPWAVWIISRGEMIRLDRAILSEWLGRP